MLMASIANLREVDVVINKRFKFVEFVVAKVEDHTGSKLIIRANQNIRIHKDISKDFQKETGLYVFCLGGGSINFDNEKMTLQIFGESGVFGKEPNRDGTVRMLQAAYPDFMVNDLDF